MQASTVCFQLMRQIDIMVNAKKVEWDSQLHVLQLQLDKKKKEAGILKIEVGTKIQEVQFLIWNMPFFIISPSWNICHSSAIMASC